jgi:biopolymer transport protein ExbD
MGPDDPTWVALESHPKLADTVADLEPKPPKIHDDDSHLDMNPLIDVCLVLLIFFILTTSYNSLHKVLDMPNVPDKVKPTKQRTITKDDIKDKMIKVEAKREKDRTVLLVDDKPVEEKDLLKTLTEIVRNTKKKEMLLDPAPEVEWGVTAAIQDAAKGAGVVKVNFLSRPAK